MKRLKSAIAVFVFELLDLIFLCVSAIIHARRTICKNNVMICLSILYKASLQTFITNFMSTLATDVVLTIHIPKMMHSLSIENEFSVGVITDS